MSKKEFILTLDQGTSSSRSLLIDRQGKVVGMAQKEFTQHFPKQGRVEHDPKEIWESLHATIEQVLREQGVSANQIEAIGITNQRETTLAWKRKSGEPIGRALVWQDKRSSALCEQLKRAGWGEKIRARTGLIIDAYFSGTKMQWILQNNDEARRLHEAGELCFGTVDSWLLWKLSRGKVHQTDATNASRTMLYDIQKGCWDLELCAAMGIREEALPEVRPSLGFFTQAHIGGCEIPIYGVAGDQQAALFGQRCFAPGMTKNTYGTGCFMLMNIGNEARLSQHGLLTTIAWQDQNETCYALEGSVFIAGAAVQWLRDGLKIIDEAPDSEYFARRASNEEAVYMVPAFVGLGAPHWDMYARGAIFGLTRDTGKSALIRATLESMAYQTKDILDAMIKDAGTEMSSLRVDGGASANDFLMQFQADILGTAVYRPDAVEATAMGAAYMAGIGCGWWTKEGLAQLSPPGTRFKPEMEGKTARKLYLGWQKAVQRCMHWIDDEP